MDRLFFALSVLLPLVSYAQTTADYIDRYYKIPRESHAHTFSGQASGTHLNPDLIKVLVWNIKKAEMKNWKSEFKEFGMDNDLLLLQEAYETFYFKSSLAEFEGFRWDMGISFMYRLYNNTATGSMIGSRVEPTYVLVKHTTDYEPAVNTPKATTFAKYPIEGHDQELLAITVHGINLTNYGTFQRHMDQIKAEILKHEGPILLAGDFNTRTLSRTEYLKDLAEELKLTTVEFINGSCRMRFKYTPYYLDHAFVRGLDVKKAEVNCNSLGSDHKPLFLEVALPQ
jgi:endonuclease/exonuclease/phosphatase (EEP) superfamily protein YafD